MMYGDNIVRGPRKKIPQPPLSNPQSDKKLQRLIKVDESEREKLVEEGSKEGIKELAKQKVENLPKLEELKSMKDCELMRIRTVFPFKFFTDCLVIEENKLTFVWSIFFWSKDIRSVLLRDISNVSIETNLFFATINVTDQFFAKDLLTINYLPKTQALEAQRLIQGLIVSARENIDYTDIPKDEVIKHALKLGEANTSTSR